MSSLDPVFDWTALFGSTLKKDNGDVATNLALSGKKTIGVYFSAHWCPPCRVFTPELAKFYNEKQANDGNDFEVVFASSDQDQAAFDEYFAEMPWFAIPFSQGELKEKLSQKFKTEDIPMLVVLGIDGAVITTKGREEVSKRPESFPWLSTVALMSEKEEDGGTKIQGQDIASPTTPAANKQPSTDKMIPPTNFAHFGLADTFFSRLSALFTIGATKPIQASDLGSVNEGSDAKTLYKLFSEKWAEECKNHPVKEDRSLVRALINVIGIWNLAFTLFLNGISAMGVFAIPQLSKAITSHQSGVDPLEPEIYHLFIALIFVIPIITSICSNHSSVRFRSYGIKITSSLLTYIYQKCLSVGTSSSHTTGQITTLYTVDVAMTTTICDVVSNLIFAPLQAAVGLAFIYRIVGVAMFAGLGVIFAVLPVISFTMKMVSESFKKMRDHQEQRIKVTQDVLSGMKMVKFYNWIVPFQKTIQDWRMKELNQRRFTLFLISLNSLLLEGFPVIMPIVVFYVYIKAGNTLTAIEAYTTIMLFTIVKNPIVGLSGNFNLILQMRVSLGKILNFINEEEKEKYVLNGDNFTAKLAVESDRNEVIFFKNASLGWVSKEMEEALEKAALELKNNTGRPKEIRRPAGGGGGAGGGSGKYSSIPTSAEHNQTQGNQQANKDIRKYETLKNLNFSVKSNELCVITGKVGSGKSSILSSLLNELHLSAGDVGILGSYSYHCQQPWILNASIKENITFGRPDDQALLDEVIRLSCLSMDLESLPGGIDTEIGEKGVNLSGGQKARISFARCLYRESDIYLLDDPLSAVDAGVGQTMFNEGIVQYLIKKKKKTVLLVTHQVNLLHNCKNILVLGEDGTLTAKGNYSEVQKYFDSQGKDDEEDVEGEMLDSVSSSDVSPASTGSRARTLSSSSLKSFKSPRGAAFSKESTVLDKEKVEKDKQAKKAQAQLMTQEERKVGVVDVGVYVYYVKSGRPVLFTLAMCCIGAGVAVTAIANFWLLSWSQANSQHMEDHDGEPLSAHQNITYINKYSWILMICVSLNYVRITLGGVFHAIEAQTWFHHNLLRKVFQAPLSFFEVTPLGRIMTRFTNDLAQTDFLAGACSFTLNAICQLVSSAVVIAITSKGTFLVLLVPLAIAFFFMKRRFTAVTTEIKRIISISKSPININFSQTIAGIDTIKAFGEADRFFSKLAKSCDNYSVAFQIDSLCYSWLNFRLDVFGAIVVFSITILTALTTESNFISAGALSLGILYAVDMPNSCRNCIVNLATLEGSMSCIERIKYYIESIEDETEYVSGRIPVEASKDAKNESFAISATDTTSSTVSSSSAFVVSSSNSNSSSSSSGSSVDSASIEMTNLQSTTQNRQERNKTVDESWPSEGSIQFNKVVLGYRKGPDVLKGLTVTINSKEKVGIVGRTGSGKSTIMTALFCIEKIRNGSIVIDGVDIAQISLNALRSKLSIIPQDPVMFAATLRYNLDPFGEHADDQIWNVLESTYMKDVVMNLKNKLDEVVKEGGTNFSVGQRQLICFARVLLKKPKILVLDEATASVDNQTDEKIQVMLREMFKDCTVLTVAHRLNTIFDSDKILVVDEGIAAEFDSPTNLLNNPTSLFRKMWLTHTQSK